MTNYIVNLPRYEFEVREGWRILSSADFTRQLPPEVKERKQEHLTVLALSAKNEVLGMKDVFVGSLQKSVAHPREIFRYAIEQNAATILVVHNHPSGDPTPSPHDDNSTRKLVDGGNLLGIPLIDHVIVAKNEYYSYAEHGKI